MQGRLFYKLPTTRLHILQHCTIQIIHLFIHIIIIIIIIIEYANAKPKDRPKKTLEGDDW